MLNKLLKPIKFLVKIPIYFFWKILNTSNRFFDNSRKLAINSLPDGGAVTLVDIGAAGEIEPRWKPFKSNLNYVGFEPDERSRETLLHKGTDFLDYKILPFALSDSKQSVTLNLCKKPMVSSLYEPNIEFLKLFPDVERFNVVDKDQLDCITLDSLKLNDLDFIKIDIQGAENDVIKGSAESLHSVLGLEIEVEFIDLYLKQPLFGDVCRELSTHGFEFMDFAGLCRWERDIHNSFGQCIFGDALFLKTPESLDVNNLNISKISSYLSILLIYRRFDLIQVTLDIMDHDLRKNFTDFESEYKKAKKRNLLARKFTSFINERIHAFGSSYRMFLIE